MEAIDDKEREDVALAIGQSESDHIRKDAREISSQYRNIDMLLHLDIREWLMKRNKTLVKLVLGATDANIDDDLNAFKLGA